MVAKIRLITMPRRYNELASREFGKRMLAIGIPAHATMANIAMETITAEPENEGAESKFTFPRIYSLSNVLIA